MAEEVWKPVQDYEEIFEISNLGRVKRCGTEKYLKLDMSSTANYARVGLCKNGKQIKYSLHRLLAQTFIPNPNNLPLVDHIDRNKLNNSLDNLRWVSLSENQRNRGKTKHNTSGHKHISYRPEHQRPNEVYIRAARYRVTIINDGKQYHRRCKTLEDALELRKNLLEELKLPPCID